MTIHLKNPLLIYALAYAAAGYRVLPLYEPKLNGCSCGNRDCQRAGKHPRLKHGVLDASSDPEVIKGWWERWPQANIGLATGQQSNLIVLDVDGPAGRASLRRLAFAHRELPESCRVKTGRGDHYYFRPPVDAVILNSAGKLGEGLDIRGEGGYVVAHPSLHASGKSYRRALWGSRGSFRRAELPGRLADMIVQQPKRLLAEPHHRPDRVGDAALADEVQKLQAAPKGQRNGTLNRCAFKLGQLVADGRLDLSNVQASLTRTALLIGLNIAEIEATIKSGLEAGQRNPRGPVMGDAQGSESPLVLDPFTRELAALGETDADNAERLARRYGKELVYAASQGYLVYDGTRWRKDDEQKRTRMAEATARAIAHEAEYSERDGDRAARARFAEGSLSKGALDRMLSVAQHRLMQLSNRFDADPFLLNVENGTLDLRTGSLRIHTASDLLTKIVAVPFDEHASCPIFEGFLERTFAGDSELIEFMQKAVGLTLTGDITEQIFFFLHGPGSTAKSTFVNLIRDLVGDYGLHTPTDTLLAKQYDNGIPTDLARLDGARMVTAIEANWNRHIDEARLKAMTGGEPITARFLRHDFFQFLPQFKLWFVANDLPQVRGTAEAFWRRVRLIPCTVEIPPEERDKNLSAKLKEEFPGILAWAVRGCLKWQAGGLGMPEAVKRGNEMWVRKADHLTKFVGDELILSAGNILQASDLNARYRTWCEKNGEKPLGDKQIKARLQSLDFTHARNRSGSVWQGVKLRLSD